MPVHDAWSLQHQHKVFTDGSNWWRDDYQLDRWANFERPVVYLGQTVGNGYELIRRVGQWCWLTRHPESREYLTIKFLPTTARGDLELWAHTLVRRRCCSPCIAKMVDSFTLPHHRASEDPDLRDITFDAVVYEATGTDIRRLMEDEDPDVPLEARLQYIRDAVRGVADLHSHGIVHGDIHAGNIGLALPADLENSLKTREPPLEDKVVRLDGQPTSPNLPSRVSEPISLGYGPGHAKIIDLGYSFAPPPPIVGHRWSYYRKDFGNGPHPALEFAGGGSTDLPFKVDSWYMGFTIYFIITNGANVYDRVRGIDFRPSDVETVESQLENFEQLEFLDPLPEDVRSNIQRLVRALMQPEPAKRMDVVDLLNDEWLMGENPSTGP